MLPDGWEVDDPYFYPRPPRGGRPAAQYAAGEEWSISIPALREEGDLTAVCNVSSVTGFLSTPSARRATSTPNSVRCCCTNFYPRPPRGGRHELRLISGCRFLFLSTPSARRATHRCAGGLNVQADFYPRPPRGGRPGCRDTRPGPPDFYPRPPRGGRRSRLDAVPPAGIFLSTPSARRATLCRVLHRQAGRISIHALREEGDQGPRSEAGHRTDFYPRPPRGGRRVRFLRSSQRHGTGGHHPISIHALREEGDPGRDRRRRWSGHFYPRPPRGGRHAGEALRVGSVIISIHALREEGDLIRLLCMANSAIFLSTPSARRATAQLAALTAELEDFYPRPPRGGRPSTPPPWSSVAHFYPRPPRGGRPALPGDLLVLFFISIHALREEGDYFANSAKYQITLFLSTPSARRATLFLQHKRPPCRFLSTPSARRATGGAAAACKKKTNFYPRPPRGGRPSETLSPVAMHSYFYPRPPRGGRRTHPASSGRAGDFYPRPPRGGRPSCSSRAAGASYFYPRPPRGGRPPCRHPADRPSNFYPRPPRGGRPPSKDILMGLPLFLSTPSARRATQASNKSHRPKPFLSTPSARRATESGTSLDKASPISIHALREEGDPQSWFYVEDVRYFYPRPPRGGRRGIPDNHATLLYFYPRPPRGGRPQQRAAAAAMVGFLSTPSARRATRPSQPSDGTPWHFYPRPPRGGRPEGNRTEEKPKPFLSTPSARRATYSTH